MDVIITVETADTVNIPTGQSVVSNSKTVITTRMTWLETQEFIARITPAETYAP